jgi:uncharacterized membrane protein
MPILIGGIALWSIAHLMPAVSPGLRVAMVSRLGEKRYKGLFALTIVASLVLIVIGWRTIQPQPVYLPPSWGRPAAIVLMTVSVYLFGAARRPAVVKRFIRHPQLSGLVTWSVAHLLANGEQRSLVLFGALGAWAIIEMIAINRRDGAWIKPEAPPLRREVLGIAITLLVFAILVLAHPWFTGVPLVRFG